MSVDPDVAAGLLQRLADLGVIHCGQSPASADVNYLGEGVPYVSGPEQWNGSTVELSKWTTNPKRLAPPNCVFITVKGAGVGTVFPGVEGAIGRDIYAFEPRPGVRRSYLEHVLRFTASRVVANAKGDIPGLSKRDLLEHRVPLPAEKDQDAIVAKIEKQFTRLDAGVAALKHVQAKLKRYRAAVLKAACEGRLVETEASLARREGRSYETGDGLLSRILQQRRSVWSQAEKTAKRPYKEPATPNASNLPLLPEAWVSATVQQLASRVADGVHQKPTYRPVGVPFVTVRNLTAGPGIDLSAVKYVSASDHAQFCKRAHPERDDLLLSKDGTLGVVRRVQCDESFSIFVSVALIKPVDRATAPYIEIALQSPQVQRQMVPKGSGLQHIHLEDLRADCVPLPPLAEQHRIVAEVERRLSVVDELEAIVTANLRRATRLRQSVLQAAFSGTWLLRT